jgi:hypothetical protein
LRAKRTGCYVGTRLGWPGQRGILTELTEFSKLTEFLWGKNAGEGSLGGLGVLGGKAGQNFQIRQISKFFLGKREDAAKLRGQGRSQVQLGNEGKKR